MRRCKYRMFAILFAFLSMASANVKAEIDNACWTSPTLKIVADLELSSLSGNKAGGDRGGRLFYAITYVLCLV